jgi:hypothetical protein
MLLDSIDEFSVGPVRRVYGGPVYSIAMVKLPKKASPAFLTGLRKYCVKALLIQALPRLGALGSLRNTLTRLLARSFLKT